MGGNFQYTGAAPIIAKCARERGILTVGVVTEALPLRGPPPDAPWPDASASASCKPLCRRHPDRSSRTRTCSGSPADEQDHLRRGLRHGRPSAAFRRALDHRPDGSAGTDQPRLRRRAHGDDRDGQGDDGHRRGHGRRPRPDGRPERHPEPAAGRSLAQGRQGRAGQRHRRPRHDAAGSRRGGERNFRAGRSGSQHHLRRRLRSVAGRHDPRERGRHRHGRSLRSPPSSPSSSAGR